ncbi:MAG: hypothetical protein R3C53_08115 [Pirellulaceae bacterium]
MIFFGTNGKSRTNRTIALLGTCGLLGFSVIQIPRLADQWEELRSQIAHHQELESSYGDPARATKLHKQLSDVEAELGQHRAAMVSSETLPSVQAELLELLKACGCQLRKVAIQAGSSGTWELEQEQNDDRPLNDPHSTSPEPGGLLPQPQSTYNLNTEQINLSLTGTLPQIERFLDATRDKPWIMRIAQINFSQTPDNDGTLAVETSIAFLSISKPVPDGRPVTWHAGSRAQQGR